MLKKNAFKALLTITGLGFVAGNAMAYRNPAASSGKGSTSSSSSSSSLSSSNPYEETSSSSNIRFGVGVQRLSAGVNGDSLNQLHLLAGITERFYIGVGYGQSSNFDDALIGGDFRYDLIKKSNAAFFLQLTAGYLRLATLGGFAGGLLAGFDYGLTEQLHASFAYGLQLQFSGSLPNHVATTNNGYVGNFGLHWFL